MRTIAGMPYVPGQARGVVSRAPRAGAIWLTDTAGLRQVNADPAGILIVDAAPFSHAMIGLLSLGRPTVMLTPAQAAGLTEGETVVLDGVGGRVLPADHDEQLDEPPPLPAPGRPVHTRDNVAVELRASVRSAAGARRARELGAAAIGLVRSEFLVPDADLPPDADFCEQAFGALCEAADPLTVIIRLIDIAADKRPGWLGPLREFIGPIGMQGARLYDREPVAGVFEAQLAAIARLQARHRLRILLPYIVRVEELVHWRTRILQRLPRPLLVGAMAETPAAALAISDFCEVADFVALGTNDLMQCLFAADRDAPALAGYLDPYAPALYRFMRRVAEDAGPQLLRVQVCGVLSQLAGGLPLLLGLGYRIFSVDPVFIPWLAATVARTDTREAAALANASCAAATSAAVHQALAESGHRRANP